jgi:hypothetical protein
MSEWWSYRPEDFLLFSEAVYWRQFELHNAAFWPAQFPALLGGLAILALLIRPEIVTTPWRARLLGLLLAGAWLASGIGFIGGRYADINFAVADFTLLFGAEAALLAMLAWFVRGKPVGRAEPSAAPSGQAWIGIGLVFYAVVLHPLTGLAAGRAPSGHSLAGAEHSLAGAEIIGLTPDPTAMMTLGVLLAGGLGGSPLIRGLSCVVPILWLSMSALTLWAMGAIEAAAPAAAVLLTLTALSFRIRS